MKFLYEAAAGGRHVGMAEDLDRAKLMLARSIERGEECEITLIPRGPLDEPVKLRTWTWHAEDHCWAKGY